jgi:hypothetical protein
MVLALLLAACGWFLMLPPNDGETIFPNAPMSKWIHAFSYDTARACEINKAELGKSKVADPDPLFERAFLFARCVPADHVPVK